MTKPSIASGTIGLIQSSPRAGLISTVRKSDAASGILFPRQIQRPVPGHIRVHPRLQAIAAATATNAAAAHAASGGPAVR
jgi:hypothetical protein